MKRPAKIKLELVDSVKVKNLHFAESLGRHESVYLKNLTSAIQHEQVIKILHEDKYLLTQFKIASKKLGLRLVFAIENEFLFIKPIRLEGESQRLFLLLREPRSLDELKTKNLELDIKSVLESNVKQGFVKNISNGRFQLTESGLKALQP